MSKKVTRLCEECTSGNLRKIKKILKGSLFSKGVPVDSILNEEYRPMRGMTPLMCASMYGNLNIVKYLVANGADVNARETGGENTPLMFAAAHGKPDVTEYLISVGADVNAWNKIGENTPLMFATAHNYSEIVKLLLKNNADKKKKNKEGLDALQMAEKRRFNGIISLLKDIPDSNAHSDKTGASRENEKTNETNEKEKINKTVERYILPLRLLLGGARAWGTLHGTPSTNEYPQYTKVREIGVLAHEENGHEVLKLLMEHIRSDGSDLYKYLELLWNNLQNEEGEEIWLM